MDREKHYTVKELPTSLRPYEKCESLGPEVLSDAELLAVVIRSGTKGAKSTDICEKILCCNEGSGLFNLHHMSIKELMQIKGVGKVKAIQFKCIAELTKRMAKQSRAVSVRFTEPHSIASYYMEDMRNLEREQLMLVMLDSKNQKLHDMVISSGTVNSSVASTREIYIQSLKYGAVNIVLLHNHPSGDPTPSTDDFKTTERISNAGLLLGIPLLDHIIIGDNTFFSMKLQGYI